MRLSTGIDLLYDRALKSKARNEEIKTLAFIKQTSSLSAVACSADDSNVMGWNFLPSDASHLKNECVNNKYGVEAFLFFFYLLRFLLCLVLRRPTLRGLRDSAILVHYAHSGLFSFLLLA